MSTRRAFLATACAAALVGMTAGLLPATAHAQAYPDRPIRLVVPYAAGGGTDAIARVIAQGMTEQLGQQLVVENNGTAGGNVATAQAAKADPDGYTLLMANQGPMTVNPHLFKNVKIDPLTAFDPGDADRRGAAGRGRAGGLAVHGPSGPGRPGQEQPGRPDLRLGRQRLGQPSRDPAARPDGRARHGARALQGCRARRSPT